MERVYSAGGVVFYKKSILLLKKENGSWVLPKGHIEIGEKKEEAALREVHEEAGVKAEILEYLDYIEYTFKDFRRNNILVHKNVSWFVMLSNSDEKKPQTEEGFIEAAYIAIKDAPKFARHNDERKIIEKAISIFESKYI